MTSIEILIWLWPNLIRFLHFNLSFRLQILSSKLTKVSEFLNTQMNLGKQFRLSRVIYLKLDKNYLKLFLILINSLSIYLKIKSSKPVIYK